MMPSQRNGKWTDHSYETHFFLLITRWISTLQHLRLLLHNILCRDVGYHRLGKDESFLPLFHICALRLTSSRIYSQARNASLRWGAETATTIDGCPTSTVPNLWWIAQRMGLKFSKAAWTISVIVFIANFEYAWYSSLVTTFPWNEFRVVLETQ